MYWREDESSSKRKNIRLGHSRRACEVNRISGQQQEPTESSLLFEMGTGRNPRPLGRGGCQFCATSCKNSCITRSSALNSG